MVLSHLGVAISLPTTEQRKDSSGEYVAYKILVWVDETNSIERPESETATFRRFSEFLYLRQYLVDTHPTVVVPPMPEKKLNVKWASGVFGDGQDAEFIESRRRSLQNFLVQVLRHPELAKDDGLHLFFSSKESWRGDLIVVDADGSRMIYQPISNLLGTAKSTQPDKKFQDIKNYAAAFQEHLNSLLAIQSRLATKVHQLHLTYHDYGSALVKFHEVETPLRETVKDMSTSFDKMATVAMNVVRQEYVLVGEPMKIFSQYAESLREVVRHQDAVQAAHEAAQKAYLAKQRTLAGLRDPSTDTSFSGMFTRWTAGSGDSRKAKEEALEKESDELKAKAQKAEDEHKNITKHALENIDRFHAEKRRELITMFLDFAKVELAFAKSSLKHWRRIKAIEGLNSD